MLPIVGPVEGVIEQFRGGLQSSMSYVGANSIKEFQEKCEFIEISSNGVKESGPHGREHS